MHHDGLSYLLGLGSALLMGLSKTGLPGASLPSILLMAEAFPHDARASVGAILLPILVGNVLAVAWFRQHADWGRLLGLFPYVALGMVPGALVLMYTKSNQLRPVLGWLVAALVVLEAARQYFGWTRLPHQWWFAAGLGILGGFGTVVGNAAMPVMTIYLISRGLLKEQFIGTAAWFFFIVNLTKLPINASLHMITLDTVSFGLIVAPLVPAGAFLGVWVLRRIPQKPFDICALALALAAAVRLIVA